MNQTQILENLSQQYDIVGTVDLDSVEYKPTTYPSWLRSKLQDLYREQYQDHQRIVVFVTEDYYQKRVPVGIKLRTLQENLNSVDISNYFCLVVSNNPHLEDEIKDLATFSADPVPVQALRIEDGDFRAVRLEKTQRGMANYEYGSSDTVGVDFQDLNPRQQFLLRDSKVFCIYPWIHLHTYPTGDAYPCCGSDRAPGPVGNSKQNSLREIWNGEPMRDLRRDMLSETWNPYCMRCYEQENTGFFSMRQSANKHLGHNITKVDETAPDGSLDRFEMTYWDIRFSNLCNLSCRSCGYMFSSKWHGDQVKLMGDWADKFVRENPVLQYAGRTEIDMWEQLIPHFDYVEQIYFAGGEPLLMDEHYRILDELERRGKFDVKLIYNTNFTHTDLRGRSVFDYWRKFDSVAVGASIDAMGPRAEFIRKGTTWSDIETNRRAMMEICPEVDFYISPTLSIMNAWHLPDLHRSWTELGLIRAQDLNINILQDPAHYRIDIATAEFKNQLQLKYQQHLDWLSSRDPLQRATQGFQSAINFMMATDNSHLVPEFWKHADQLDTIRREQTLAALPELRALT
jgi:MoaA/NifB/PqqE/SkfB family radical SAM enzyme